MSQQDFTQQQIQQGQLDNAMIRMQRLIGEHFNNQEIEDQNGQKITLSNNSLEEYVQLLDQKYNSILHILKNEEVKNDEYLKQNVQLKSELAYKIKESQDFKLKNQKLIEKSLELKGNYQDTNQDNIYSQLNQVKTQKLNDILDKIQEELQQKAYYLINLQSQISYFTNEGEKLQEDLQGQQQVFDENIQFWEQQQYLFKQKMKELIDNKNLLNQRIQQKNDNEITIQNNSQKYQDLYGQNEEILGKLTFQQQKFQQKEQQYLKESQIIENLQNQLHKVKEELEDIRLFNNSVEKISKNKDQIYREYIYVSAQHDKLQMHNSFLKEEQQKIKDFKQFSQQVQILDKNIEKQKSEEQQQQTQEEQNYENGEQEEQEELSPENLKNQIEKVKQVLESRELIKERQLDEVKEKQEKLNQVNYELEQIEISKASVENAIQELEQQMDYLAKCFNYLDRYFEKQNRSIDNNNSYYGQTSDRIRMEQQQQQQQEIQQQQLENINNNNNHYASDEEQIL